MIIMTQENKATSFIELIEPTELYNILNQCFEFPCASDQNFLYLLDAREYHEYNESHVITAKRAIRDNHGQFAVPFDAELECKKYVVVYDGTTDQLENQSTPALSCAQVMAGKGSRNPVKILKGGYERFSAAYPFLRTQKILWLPKELDQLQTYPMEVLPGMLYIGNAKQAGNKQIHKDLKIKGSICCSSQNNEICKSQGNSMLIPIQDTDGYGIKDYLTEACAFIDTHRDKNEAVLIFSDLGFSRAPVICIAYLMHTTRSSVQESYMAIKQSENNACPNSSFMIQLEEWHNENIASISTSTS